MNLYERDQELIRLHREHSDYVLAKQADFQKIRSHFVSLNLIPTGYDFHSCEWMEQDSAKFLRLTFSRESGYTSYEKYIDIPFHSATSVNNIECWAYEERKRRIDNKASIELQAKETQEKIQLKELMAKYPDLAAEVSKQPEIQEIRNEKSPIIHRRFCT